MEDLLLCISSKTKDVNTVVVFYNTKPRVAHSG